MSDILSQEEVDALLTAVSSGNLNSEPESDKSNDSQVTASQAAGPENIASVYDFRRPDRVSKDQMRTLQNLHEGYARLLSTTLSSYLRSLVEIEVVSVDQLTYSEFISSISSPSCIFTFQMEPLEGLAILEINPSLVFFIVDRLFGGQGKPTEHNRELTDIEQNVLQTIVDRSLHNLQEVWDDLGKFTPRIESYETNPQFVRIAPPSETVILISLEVRLKHGSGLISLCFPYMLLEPIITKLTGESWISGQRESTPETRQLLENELSSTEMLVSSVVGETSLTIRDLLQLRSGDVVVLDKLVNSELVVKVAGKSKFLGKVGIVGRNKSIQITSVLDQEVGEDG